MASCARCIPGHHQGAPLGVSWCRETVMILTLTLLRQHNMIPQMGATVRRFVTGTGVQRIIHGRAAMSVHDSVHQMAKRLWFFIPVAGGAAAGIFLLTLSHSVYPGVSAALSASAVGVSPYMGISHPLFSLAARAAAAVDLFSLPIRLNVLSVLCGTCCVMLLYHLVSRLILFSACEDEGGSRRDELMEDLAAAPVLPYEVDRYNRRVFKISITGGLTAAFLLTFLAPTWVASTRLEFGMFDLLLALGALSLFPFFRSSSGCLRLALSFFVFVLGLVESAVFVLFVPVYAFFIFDRFVLSNRRATMLGSLIVAGLFGSAVALYAVRLNMADMESVSLVSLLRSVLLGLPVHHYRELGSLLPRTGWVQILLQTGLPAIILLFGRYLLFKEKGMNTVLALLLIVFAVAPGLLNLPFAPFSFFHTFGHLPVFGYAIIATAAAVALSACLIFCGPEDTSRDESGRRMKPARAFGRGLTGAFLALLFLFVLLAPVRNFHTVDARHGLFADEVARKMLGAMKSRTWLISSGFLDDHLRIQAFMAHQPLALVSLGARPSPQEHARISKLLESDSAFEGLNRQRLQNALSIGVVHFVMEWFKMDAGAGSRAVVFATPDIWTECGYRAVPEGLAFGGVRPEQRLDLASIEQNNRSFAEQLMPLINKQKALSGPLDEFREILRMRFGFVFNELGVMLEDGGELEATYWAYERAIQIDPKNVSAAINAYSLVLRKRIHSDALDKMKKRVSAVMSNHDKRVLGLMGVLQNYGTIRDPAFYQQQSALWSAIGPRRIAVDRLQKALALSDQVGASALVQKAMVCASAGDAQKAETWFLAALSEDGANEAAFSGLCTLMLNRRNTGEAEKWLHKAQAAGLEKDALMFQTITLAILKKETDQALKLLESATEKYPDDLRYWTLLADIFLNRGDVESVEYTVLPKMKKRLKNPDHFLVHAIQGLMLRKKGPSRFKEARLSLLSALSLNASLPEIWSAVFELDVALGNLEFLEADTKILLRVDSGHAQANYLMGVCMLARREAAAAEDFFRRSIEKQPTAAAHNDLAECLRLQKRLPDAEASARRALEMDPGLTTAQDTLACVLCDAGRYAEAEELARKVVSLKPTVSPYQLTLLRAEVGLGKKEEVRRRCMALAESKCAIPKSLQAEIDAMK